MKKITSSLSFCIILIGTLAISTTSCKKSNLHNQPNLLVIQTDEHNFHTIGAYRETLSNDQAYLWGSDVAVETPQIDELANNGVLCTSFYASTPVCSPSRSSFMSGRYPHNTAVVTNDIPMLDEIITFAHVLGNEGYATGYAGKWHLDGLGKPQWEPERDFGFTDNRYMFNRGHWKLLEDTDQGPKVSSLNAKGKPDYGIEGANEENFTTDFLAKKTIEFIKDHQDEPFCFMLSLPDPHGPNTVRPPYDTMYEHFEFEIPATASKDESNLPSWGKKANRTINRNGIINYFGMVKCIDDNVGKIMRYLDETGLRNRTIVVFTSDHGDLLGEHGKDNKGVPYEGSAKINFIISYPNSLPSGLILDQAFSCVDFTPTILSLMGAPPTGLEEGRDASALFMGQSVPDWDDIAFMRGTGSRTGPDENWLAAVSDRYKLL